MKRKERIITGLILILFLAAAVYSLFIAGDVEINYDLSAYLNEDTDTKQALEIIDQTFGMTTDLKIMIPDISRDQAKQAHASLADLEHVVTVTFDAEDPASYQDGHALFTLLIDGDEYSQHATDVISDAQELLSPQYPQTRYSGTAMDAQTLRTSITEEMLWILAIALVLVVIILLITAGSWMEPLVLLLSSGIGVAINMGTNLILGEISYITNSVAAILQLALSIDYSIVLLHSYRTRLSDHAPGFSTMLNTVKSVFRPVMASGLTTMVGLLALLFMSFRIGFDIGIVLLKGIGLSLIASLIFFPALLLWVEPLMQKTQKKGFVPQGKPFVKLTQKFGPGLLIMFVVLLVFCCVFQKDISYSFSSAQGGDPVIDATFGKNNTVILVYDKQDQARESEYIQRLSQLKNADGSAVLLHATGYSNTVLQEYDLETACAELDMPEDKLKLLYTMYVLQSDPDAVTMTAADFLDYATILMETDPEITALTDTQTRSSLASMQNINALMDGTHTAVEFAQALAACNADMTMPQEYVDQLYLYYYTLHGNTQTGIPGRDFIAFLLTVGETDPQFAALFSPEMLAGLLALQQIDGFLADETPYTYSELYSEMSRLFQGMDQDTPLLKETHLQGIYTKYASENHPELLTAIPAKELLAFVLQNMEANELLLHAMNDDDRQQIQAAQDALASAEALFCSESHHRLLLTLNLPNEGTDTQRFMEEAKHLASNIFTGETYLAGTIPSTHDLVQAFDYDNTLISIFTITSVFLIVMLLFRSLSLPTVLVLVIQGAIYLAMTIMVLTDTSVFFMSYIMATCILMGATIDYGILMSSAYASHRKTLDRNEALPLAVDGAMPTVFTSGLILTIAGFVISFVSSQQAISTTGLMIGVGAAASTVFITLVLPSILYWLDKFIVKLTK